jgi:hypothetical protein
MELALPTSRTRQALGLMGFVLLLLPLAHNWTLKYDFQVPTDVDVLLRLVLMVFAIVAVLMKGVTKWFVVLLFWSLGLSFAFGLSQDLDQKLINEIALSTVNFFGPIAIVLYVVRARPDEATLLRLFRWMALLFIGCTLYISYVVFYAPDLITGLKFGEDIVANIFLVRGGRLSLTFSEPSHAGFTLGFMVLFFINSFRKHGRKTDLLLVLACLVMLLASGAKFAIPITLLCIVIMFSGTAARHVCGWAVYASVGLSLVGYLFLGAIYDLISRLPFELQETFVTRLSFFFSTSEFLATNPLGYGFSKLFETDVVNVVCDRVRDATLHQVNAGELAFYCSEPGLFFGAKEQFSLMSLHFGVIGLAAFVLAFRYLKNLSKDPRYLTYFLYFTLSIIFYERFTGINPGIYPLVAMGLIYHEKK